MRTDICVAVAVAGLQGAHAGHQWVVVGNHAQPTSVGITGTPVSAASSTSRLAASPFACRRSSPICSLRPTSAPCVAARRADGACCASLARASKATFASRDLRIPACVRI